MVKKQQDDHVKKILNPELRSYRAMQIAKGIKPKNFAKLNRMKIKQAKRERKERKEKEKQLEEGKKDFSRGGTVSTIMWNQDSTPIQNESQKRNKPNFCVEDREK